MKKILITLIAALVTISFLLLPACASRKEAPDPVKVQEQIAEYRSQELDLVRSTVSDEERAERLIDLLADRDRLIARHTKEIGAHREEMSALNADYNARRESFDEQMTGYNNQRATAQKEFVSLIEAMKKQTTAEEWKTISTYQLKRLDPRELTYGQSSGGA
jgi:peptidoglycan hydrolase CwlO-like protein